MKHRGEGDGKGEEVRRKRRNKIERRNGKTPERKWKKKGKWRILSCEWGGRMVKRGAGCDEEKKETRRGERKNKDQNEENEYTAKGRRVRNERVGRRE